jgi:tetratricopeptide (TPR) repeat protein
MTRGRILLLVGLVALGLGEFCWIGWRTAQATKEGIRTAQARIAQVEAAAAAEQRSVVKPGRIFSNAEVYAFLTKAKQAETIADPLQRCLAYPDPPDSHWLPAAVQAYCQFRMQSLMPFSQMQALIENGQAAELDKRLAGMLEAQSTQPNARGLLDRTYLQDFDGSFTVREVIDAWKRASPNSAFAYAASGFAYEKMAHKARGNALMENTPQSSVESMDRLLQQADADLQKAIALNPRITPIYDAMIAAGGLSFGQHYAAVAIKQAQAVDPASFAIYSDRMWLAQPNWYGSVRAMKQVAADAQTHADKNPLLVLEISKAMAYNNLDDCDCHTADQLAAYSTIFDQVATSQQLLSAGHAAESSHSLGLAVVYFSEAMRFEPDLPEERIHRIYELNNFDESQWAVNEATQMAKVAPGDAMPLKARGYSYEMLGDYPNAVADQQRATELAPDDESALIELVRVQTENTHDWNGAWAESTLAMQRFPNSPAGWIYRAMIQKDQPRAGMQQTVDDFATRFGSDPGQLKTLTWLRAQLALQQGQASQARSLGASVNRAAKAPASAPAVGPKT